MSTALIAAPAAQVNRRTATDATRLQEAGDLRVPAASLPWPSMEGVQQAFDYCIDAWQRSVLFLDALRQRGNSHFEESAKRVPNVLNFDFELIMDGRELQHPVNYGLVRIVPPAGVAIDLHKRPFIVFDPRAGHGPGIGGMKHDSEIGIALAAGHPCYFVGFLPDPVPGQTVEDVCRAEAAFIRKVIERHPMAEGKPCLVGNCQAGWQIMMTAAIEPDLVGPLVIVGSPLSYWAGVHGKNPMRYTGGLLGGTWLTSLAGDLGHGIFDGANLVGNFEYLNPSNTYWEKAYNLYSKVDTGASRYLEFEKWWGSPVLLNAKEMQDIADELFVGNKLASGEIYTSEGVRLDLRNIKSPIVVFCSWGDNITPPQQALGWILDLYNSEDEIVANGQTIIYALHQSIGHLGIFVSSKVAKKEHEEFAQTMDLIDVLPPGLYEAVFTEKGPETAHPELVAGDYVVRFEARTLGHIRALGGNDAEDERRFATVAHVSAITQGLYRTFLSPAVQQLTNDYTAGWLRRLHPHRLPYEILSDKNPFMAPIAAFAEQVRANRRAVAPDNPFLGLQEMVSRQIVDALDRYRDARDRFCEELFLSVYGSPLLQAAVGLRADAATARPRVGRDVAREAAAARALAELEARVGRGGVPEAVVRALLYIGLGEAEQAVDERGFAVLRQIREEQPESQRLTLAEFKDLVRAQHLLLHRDEERAVSAVSQMLPADASERMAALKVVRRIVSAGGDVSDEAKRRLARVEAMFQTREVAASAAGREGLETASVRHRSKSRRHKDGGSVRRAAANSTAKPG
jgi:pimeloyl-ACP methyl ester carboxylesterase